MTGQGQAHCSNDRYSVVAEIRAVNNRFLKISFNSQDMVSSLVPELEAVVRDQVRRGSVNDHVKIERQIKTDQYRIDASVIRGYQQQISKLSEGASVSPADLLALPGVIIESDLESENDDEHLQIVKEAVRLATEKLNQMRQNEGQAMAEELVRGCDEIIRLKELVAVRAPNVVEQYAVKLEERINQMLAKISTEIERKDILREVGVFADRCDVAEELVRLQSHVEQFKSIVDSKESNGRKLDFLTQELLRETNTIGSKANDAEIAGHVVEMKTVIERIRELVQNVE